VKHQYTLEKEAKEKEKTKSSPIQTPAQKKKKRGGNPNPPKGERGRTTSGKAQPGGKDVLGALLYKSAKTRAIKQRKAPGSLGKCHKRPSLQGERAKVQTKVLLGLLAP